ncbi:hypothetical protein [Burkholderia plantarii]|uniref:hypothetical protein n=1 Tax=Burkholderia plantarii TaxID=41899 RepID=UPI0018DE1819|nr:hypothetical protein [Burkholderia plantarii]MBI0328579.1 hypothetical protein [Burkholderia plantarii]
MRSDPVCLNLATTPACIPFLLVAQALGAHLVSISRGRSPSPEAVFSNGFLHLDNMGFGIISGLASTSKNETAIRISGYLGIRQKIMQTKNQFGNFSHHEIIVNEKSRKTPAVHTDSIHVAGPIGIWKSGSATLPGATSKKRP